MPSSSNSNWNTSGLHAPCPVCGRTKDQDCSVAADGKTVLCHTKANSSSSVPQPADLSNGYKFTGRIESHGCLERGVYVLDQKIEKFQKPANPKSDQTFYYPTEGKLCRVRRIDNGKGDKTIWQEYWLDDDRMSRFWIEGCWVCVSENKVKQGKATKEDRELYLQLADPLQKQIHLYLIDHELNQKAKVEGGRIFLVEGEPKVRMLLSLGIAATTAIGGSNAWDKYGHANYAGDLEGAKIVLCPDRDKPGIEHMLRVMGEFEDKTSIEWLYANPVSPNWLDPYEKGADKFDIKNWIEYLQEQGFENDRIKDLVLDAIEPQARDFNRKEKKEAKQDKSDWLEGENGQLLDPADEVKTAFDAHVFTRLFQSGNGEWCTIDSSFYRYDGKGAWKAQNDDDVQQMISTYSMGCYKLKKIGDEWAANQCFGKNANTRSAFEFSRTMLNRKARAAANTHLRAFRNCTINLITGEILEHSKEHYLTTKVDADYFPDAECPDIFLKFVRSSFGIEMLELIRALTYMFLDPTAPYGKFVHILGPSGSGKGTMIRFWQEVFGLQHSRSSASLSELEKPEGRHQGLTGVSFFAVPDIGGYLSGLKPFYELVDNGAMSGRALFAPSGYQKKWNCRFAIASVDHLQIENSGDGWDRRCILLPTKQRVGPIDKTLEDELIAAKSQIISWVLGMDKTRRDYVIASADEIEQIEAMKSDARTNGDSVQLFVELCLRPDPFSTEKVENAELHTYYEAFCQVHGLQKMGYPRFISHLKTVLPNNHRARRKETAADNPGSNRGWISAHWAHLKPLDNLFINVDFQKGYAECVKSKCQEGGMHAFKRFVAESVNGSAGWSQEVVEPLPRLSRFESLVFFNLLSTVNNSMCSGGHNGTSLEALEHSSPQLREVSLGSSVGYCVPSQSQNGKGFQELEEKRYTEDMALLPFEKNSDATSKNQEEVAEKISKVDSIPVPPVPSKNGSPEVPSDKAASQYTDASTKSVSDAPQTLSDQSKGFQVGDEVTILNWSGQVLSGVGRVAEVGDGGCFIADHPTVYGWVNLSDLRPHQSL